MFSSLKTPNANRGTPWEVTLGHLHNDCVDQNTRKTEATEPSLCLWQHLQLSRAGLAGSRAETSAHCRLFLLHFHPTDHWGAHSSLSKLDYKTTPESLSLILDNDTCSVHYLTDLWLSIKVVIHSNNNSSLGPRYNSAHPQWNVAQSFPIKRILLWKDPKGLTSRIPGHSFTSVQLSSESVYWAPVLNQTSKVAL